MNSTTHNWRCLLPSYLRSCLIITHSERWAESIQIQPQSEIIWCFLHHKRCRSWRTHHCRHLPISPVPYVSTRAIQGQEVLRISSDYVLRNSPSSSLYIKTPSMAPYRSDPTKLTLTFFLLRHWLVSLAFPLHPRCRNSLLS